MLSFFRRLINSKVGIIVAIGTLIVIGLSFGLGDVTGLGSRFSGAPANDVAAEIGKVQVSIPELRKRVQTQLQVVQQQNPGVTMAQFVQGGGFDNVLDRVIDQAALAQFGRNSGMVVSKRAVDGRIASQPGFQGPDGKFSEAAYRQQLAQIGLTDADVRAQLSQGELVQQLTIPQLGANQVPSRIAQRYASLLLEARQGSVAVIPAAAMPAGADPSAAELQTFYQNQRARYALPERRVIKYALVNPDAVKAQATPSDAEIAQAYAADKPRFAARQTRTITRVVTLDQASANAIATKVKGGTALAEAARAAGLEPATATDVTQQQFAQQTSPAVAATAFGAAKASLVGPVQAPLGWVVARVDAITQAPAKSLEQARPELAKELTTRKTAQALTALRSRIDNALNGNLSFDQIASANKLTVATTPAVSVAGVDPLVPDAKPDPKLAPVVQAGFSAQPNQPLLAPAGQDGSFALVAVAKALPAAPRPLAEIQPRVIADFKADRQARAARQVAAGIAAKVNAGTPLAAAVASSDAKGAKIQPIAGTRAQLAAARNGVPAALQLLFALAPKHAGVLTGQDGRGFGVIVVDSITPGNAAGKPQMITDVRGDLARSAGEEYAQGLVLAARQAVGVKRNEAAIDALKRELTGQATAADQP